MAREFLWIVKESAYCTPMASPSAGVDSIYIRLDEGNAFTMRPKPIQVKVKSGGGRAVAAFKVSGKQEVKGNLSVKLCASQAALLLAWASQLINAGQTTPWTTTEPAGDLASCSVYHAIQRSDGSFKRRVYLGTKVTDWELETTEDATLTTLKLGLVASTPQGNQFDSSSDPTSGAFPAPADTAYPTDAFLFIHTSGGLSIASTRNKVSRIKVTSKNAFGMKYWNSRFLGDCHWVGRESTLEASLYYAPSPDDRASFEGLATLACSLAFNNGSHTASLSMNANNSFANLDDDLPVDNLYLQGGTQDNMWDPNAGIDLLWSFT